MNIKKVAQISGVSTATVSRTINGSPLVSKRTAEAVWKTIRQLGYFPNTQARALVSGHSRILGLIISDITNPFFPELVKSFENAAIHQGYEVIVANTDYEQRRMGVCVRRMIERQVDGVAIMTSEIERGLLDQLASRRLPIVFLDHAHKNLRGPISDIAINYADGVRQSVDYLLALGHRDFAFLSGPLTLASARIRRKAFLDHLSNNGIQVRRELIVEGNHKVDGGVQAMRRVLACQHRPTAVLCSNDLTAIGALRAVHEAGLRTPEDISLIGFDDILMSGYTQPPLTTIRISREELGRQAFEQLYLSLSQPEKEGSNRLLETTLVLRHSAAAPPRG